MATIRWDPTGDACRLENWITEMFDEAFPCLCSGESPIACDWQPAVDVYPKDRRIVISVDLPGGREHGRYLGRFANGVLNIEVPLSEEERTRKIAVFVDPSSSVPKSASARHHP
jgi:HSP20 family molecular chaperone IbpA